MRGVSPHAYQRNPQFWANAVREKVSPRSLQCEIVQMILFDYDAGWAFPAFEEWTGDPNGWGPPVKCIHTDEEIRGALDAIGYSRKRNIAMGNDMEGGGLRLGEATSSEDYWIAVWNNMSRDIDKGYQAFWLKRGMWPPRVSANTISS